ncbi:hypothetical protein M3D15_06875 [Pseudoclavibacter alba]|uniref:Uncharacterized protein n=1 Tax=Pseudoclavibacter albus TaxID=272241 RepID=A0ABT2HXK8_9MICO|nr:hypothetical protein [Pseudoclavibacter alba]MCT2043054.1 hypothetical protein [Pseudoclavibacter alba]
MTTPPLFVSDQLDPFGTPNCPICLERMILLGPEGAEEWTCPDPDCGAIVMF